jgi:hypothetical protein
MSAEGDTMSNRKHRTLTRAQALARDAAYDCLIGAGLGLLLVSGFIACSIDFARHMIDDAAPMSLLVSLTAAVVAECAIAAGLAGAALRRFSTLD